MVIAGIIGSKNNNIFKCLNILLSGNSLKYSIVDYNKLMEDEGRVFSSYLKELYGNDFDLVLIYFQEDENLIKGVDFEFDVVIFTTDDKGTNIFEENRDFCAGIINHLHNNGTVLYNSDFTVPPEIFQRRAFHMITYGFNSKASITASSVGDSLTDDFFLCSLQRSTIDIQKRVLEPQEYKLKRLVDCASDNEMLAIISAGIVLGVI